MSATSPRPGRARTVILQYLRNHGASTTSEVRDGTGLGYGAVRDHLIRLEVTGAAVRCEGMPTRYRLANGPSEA